MDEKLSTRVYREIRDGILNGRYTPRDFLTESAIAGEFKVSKAPVKEALHTLTDQGFLISYPRKGYMVAIYSDEEIDKIQEIRKALETVCVRNAVKNASDAQIQALRFFENADPMQMNPKETINYRFHVMVADLSGNEFMTETLKPLIVKATLSQIKSEPEIDKFNRIVDAMLERDEDKAAALIDEDIRYLKR